MSKKLVLAEKPSVAREIGKVLGCTQKGNGFLEGPKYVIVWGLGHLVELEPPEHYDKKYKTWELETLPIIPNKFDLAVMKKTSKHFFATKAVFQRKDLDELIIATDAGREGELVARWIILKAGWKKPIKRLWISSQTSKAIKDGFNNLKDGKSYENLFYSARSRAEADWIVGLNITRALTCKYNAQLSAGRVQTPTLNIIVKREEEIRKFVPMPYWQIEAHAKNYKLIWQDKKTNQTQIFDKILVETLNTKLSGKNGKLVDVKKTVKKELHPLLYDLTELQRDANKKYGYSPKETLNIMQQLYERHKIVTYPRTDSRYITDDIVPTLKERLLSINNGPYKELIKPILNIKITGDKRYVDNNKVSDHHAIIPTEEFVDLSALETNERHIYDLIVKRFISIFYEPYEYEQTKFTANINGEIFTTSGKVKLNDGWKAIYNKSDLLEDNSSQALPPLKINDNIDIQSIKIVSLKTNPPPRYNEATLLTAMENPGKFIDDSVLRDSIEKTSGLGTSATRADIIEKLYNINYVEKRANDLYPTSKGKQLISLVPNDLKSPELTAKWEQELEKISKGKTNPIDFLEKMKKYSKSLVSGVISSSSEYKHDNMTRESCPDCGKYLLKVEGKKGSSLACSDRECGYRKNVSRSTNARCPECHKKMDMRGEGEKEAFFCICGYREKLSHFKAKQTGKVDKNDVSKFMKKQNTDDNINSALAEALAKWKK